MCQPCPQEFPQPNQHWAVARSAHVPWPMILPMMDAPSLMKSSLKSLGVSIKNTGVALPKPIAVGEEEQHTQFARLQIG